MLLPAHRSLFLPGGADGLAATVALASSQLFGAYVGYARPGARWFAGDALAEVVCEADRIRWSYDGHRYQSPLGARPLRRLGDVIATLPMSGRRAYGYVTFEMGLLANGIGRPRPGSAPLAHFIVPRVEVEWTAAGCTVRSPDAHTLDAVADIVSRAHPEPASAGLPVDLTSAASRAEYERAVTVALDAIGNGLLHKVVLSRRWDLPVPIDLPQSYGSGLAHNTPARSFLLRLGQQRCAGFSPETIAEVDSAHRVLTQPLAGTRPRVGAAEADRRLREELTWDVKECYEHAISARLAAEELQGICRPGSVGVRDLMSVRERGSVQHLASTVVGRLRAGLDRWDALAALFPAVTASGIPKPEAIRMIQEMEGDRGLYSGAVCLLDGQTGLDSALVLRSMFQDPSGRSWLRAGAGIVANSEPAKEYDETTAKLRSAAACLVAAPGGGAAVAGHQPAHLAAAPVPAASHPPVPAASHG
jgi:salicylate synthase